MTTRLSIGRRRLLITLAVGAGALLAVVAPVRGQELGDRCTNAESGYTVDFPSGWYVNAHVEGGESDDVAACRLFSPDDFEVRPASAVSGVAIAIGVQQSGPPERGEPATVGGRPATVVESVTETDGVEPAGTRHYSYWIELGNGTWLLANTSDGPNWVGDFAANRAILDSMMDSLAFGAAGLPDTAIRAGSPALALGATVLLLVAVALALRTLRLATPTR